MAQSEYRPRRLPTQARSRERVERILDAAAQLLTEEGYDAVKTNHIAKRAEVSIGSIYQFFPNRYAIFHALAVRYMERIARLLDEHMGDDARALPWDEVIRNVIDQLAEVWRTEPALHAVWMAIQNTAELRVAEEHYSNRVVSDTLEGFLGALLPDLPRDRRIAVARVLFEVTQRLLDHSMRPTGEQDQVIIEELKIMVQGYIEAHLKRGIR